MTPASKLRNEILHITQWKLVLNNSDMVYACIQADEHSTLTTYSYTVLVFICCLDLLLNNTMDNTFTVQNYT